MSETKELENKFLDAVRWGELEKVAAIISQKKSGGEYKALNLDCKDKYDRTAIMVAAKHGHAKLIRLLGKENVDIHHKDPNENNALMYAAMGGHKEACEVLMKLGANVCLENKFGKRCNDLATKAGHQELGTFLEQAGAYADLETGYDEKVKWKNTLGEEIKIAEEKFLDKTRWGELEPVKAILDQGLIDVNCVDKYKRSALMVAAKRGHFPLVRLLIKNNANLDLVDPSGNSALMFAAMSGHLDIFTTLVEAGANVALENNHGYRVDTLAAKQGHDKIREKAVASGVYADLEDGYDEKTYWKKNIVIRPEQDEIDINILSALVRRLFEVNLHLTGTRMGCDFNSVTGLLDGLERVTRSLPKISA